jgi:spore coat protein W
MRKNCFGIGLYPLTITNMEVNTLSNEKLNLQEISSSMMQLFVQDVFNKNNITDENKKTLTDDQKEKLKKVVADLQAQVDEYVKTAKEKKEEKPAAEAAPKNTTLRDMMKNRKKDK